MGTNGNDDRTPDDLGFGRRVAEESRVRLLNHDGSFNVARLGLPFFRSLHLYHSLLTMSWPKFLFMVGIGYLVVNVLFAVGFLLCGPGALSGSTASGIGPRLLEAFFFSDNALVAPFQGMTAFQFRLANERNSQLTNVEATVVLNRFEMRDGRRTRRFTGWSYIRLMSRARCAG